MGADLRNTDARKVKLAATLRESPAEPTAGELGNVAPFRRALRGRSVRMGIALGIALVVAAAWRVLTQREEPADLT